MSFPLVGNNNIKKTLLNAIDENRLPHAIVIEGEEGSGRHTLASFLAKAHVCEGSKMPCDECKNCRLCDSSTHPDIIVITPEAGKKNIAVGQIRDLINETYVKPHMATKKVFVIDYAHTMNENSQNAILKVLEEPPECVAFILIAETKAALLETVVSRCVCFSIGLPERSTACEYIKENTDFSFDDINNALDKSHNNIGKALDMLKGELAPSTELAAGEFIECFLKGDTFSMLKICAEFEKNRVEASKFFKALKRLTVDNLKNNINNNKARRLSNLYTQLSNLEYNLNANINLGLLFCTLVSRADKL